MCVYVCVCVCARARVDLVVYSVIVHPSLAAGDPSPSSPGTSSLDEELAWCVSQLELGLQRKGVSKEQKDHNILLIRRLQSEKTPLPKKRALMRTTFGDYRAKMRESPLPQVTVPQFISTQQKGVGSAGRVYRMSTR